MKAWDEEKIETLKQLYPDQPTGQVAEALGMTVRQVYYKVSRIGIKKSKEYMSGPHACRLKGDVGAGTRFKKGHATWNKGQPGSTGTHPNCVRTQFKKGERRGVAKENYKPVGSYRINPEGYLELKVDENPNFQRRWRGVHRILWESTFGPVPDGYIVVFRDGKKTTKLDEITIDRLEVISRRENMIRNSIHNLPKDIALALQMLGALNRKINDVTRKNDQ